MKITFLTFLVGTLAISGIPPFSGFFSKDEILSQAFQYNPALYSLALLGALLTAFYMFRLLFLVFFGKSRTGEKTALHVHESPPVMTYPLLILAVLALLGGCLNLPEIFGGNAALTSFLSPSIHLSSGESMPLPHSTEAGLMTLSTLLILAVIILAGVLYLRMKKIPPPDEIRRTPVIQWLLRKLYVDEFYNFLLVKPYEFLSGTLYTKLENNLINPLVNGFGNSTVLLSNALRRLQAGNVSFYIFVMVAGILLFLMLNLYI